LEDLWILDSTQIEQSSNTLELQPLVPQEHEFDSSILRARRAYKIGLLGNFSRCGKIPNNLFTALLSGMLSGGAKMVETSERLKLESSQLLLT
jgi:hypothetical protein